MSNKTAPTLEIVKSFNGMLGADAKRQDIAFYVTPKGFDNSVEQPPRLMALGLDISASMSGAKIGAAVEGSCAFLDAMEKSPNNYVAVYLFGRGKYRLFRYALATTANIAKAKKELRSNLPELESHTNTAGGLQLAREDFEALAGQGKVSEMIVALLTDGDYGDDSAVREEVDLYKALAKQGRSIKVAARGVGTNWNVDKLNIITAGTLSMPPVVLENPSEVRADFEQIVETAAQQKLSNVTMVIQKYNMGEVIEIGVSSPVNLDLFHDMSVVPGQEQFIRVNLGPWDNETRLFHLGYEVTKPTSSAAIMACQIHFEYTVSGRVVQSEKFRIPAQWARNSHEQTLSARVDRGVAKALGIKGSQRRMEEAAKAIASGNGKGAVDIFSDMVKIASEEKDQDLLDKLSEFVEIEDAATGKVKLKGEVNAATAMKLSSKSSIRRVRDPNAEAAAASAVGSPENTQA